VLVPPVLVPPVLVPPVLLPPLLVPPVPPGVSSPLQPGTRTATPTVETRPLRKNARDSFFMVPRFAVIDCAAARQVYTESAPETTRVLNVGESAAETFSPGYTSGGKFCDSFASCARISRISAFLA
jgi:hypothetical protein